MVSSASVTGSQTGFEIQAEYFKRIANMNLKTPQVGFGINNAETFNQSD
jgi:tryptophan synthase alpha subunit